LDDEVSTRDILFKEVERAPDALVEEVLDFIRFLKSRRYSSCGHSVDLPAHDIDVVFDQPRTRSILANEQCAFLASIGSPIDFDLATNG
jgi:hypothetical protein